MAIRTLSKQFQETVEARDHAQRTYLIYRLECEHMDEEKFTIPKEAKMAKETDSVFEQFKEIEKDGVGGLTAKERTELMHMLTSFLGKFKAIEKGAEERIQRIHDAWQAQYLERENTAMRQLKEHTGDY